MPVFLLWGLRAAGGLLVSLGAADVLAWFSPKKGTSQATAMPIERVLLLVGLGVLAIELVISKRKGRL